MPLGTALALLSGTGEVAVEIAFGVGLLTTGCGTLVEVAASVPVGVGALGVVTGFGREVGASVEVTGATVPWFCGTLLIEDSGVLVFPVVPTGFVTVEPEVFGLFVVEEAVEPLD